MVSVLFGIGDWRGFKCTDSGHVDGAPCLLPSLNGEVSQDFCLFWAFFLSFFFSRVFNKRLISVTQLKAAADHVKFLLTLKNYSFWRRNNLLPVI